jgi:hypothetical protein
MFAHRSFCFKCNTPKPVDSAKKGGKGAYGGYYGGKAGDYYSCFVGTVPVPLTLEAPLVELP